MSVQASRACCSVVDSGLSSHAPGRKQMVFSLQDLVICLQKLAEIVTGDQWRGEARIVGDRPVNTSGVFKKGQEGSSYTAIPLLRCTGMRGYLYPHHTCPVNQASNFSRHSFTKARVPHLPQ